MSLLRNGPFVRLWTGQTVAEFGYNLSLVALPLVAVMQLGADSVQMGLFVGAGMAPMAFAWPLFGVLVDRVDRRRILLATYVGRGLLLSWVPIGAALGVLDMLQLVAVYFLVSLLQVAFEVAAPSLLPQLVEDSDLVQANSRMEMTRSGAVIVGPALAGFLVEAITPANTVAMDAVCYLLASGLILTLPLVGRQAHTGRGAAPAAGEPAARPGHPAPAEAPADSAAPAAARPESFRRQLTEGWSFVFGDTRLRVLAFSSGLMNAFFYIRTPLLALFVVQELRFSGAQLGLVLAAAGPGALLGAMAAGRLSRRFGLSRTLTASAFLAGAPVLAVPFVPAESIPGLAMLMASTFAVSCGVQIYGINLVSFRQLITPDRLLGRVNATFRWAAWAMAPFAAVLSGFLADLLGLRGAIAVAAAGLLLPGLLLLVSRLHRADPAPAPGTTTTESGIAA
ncbi:MFS transporter [Streptomyces sp. NPDC012794]|uniref:MFS transporter n=1 Tax=Streptomyces sp. NPDC012794 TaxID=3364850 RepID=UPI003696F01A